MLFPMYSVPSATVGLAEICPPVSVRHVACSDPPRTTLFCGPMRNCVHATTAMVRVAASRSSRTIMHLSLPGCAREYERHTVESVRDGTHLAGGKRRLECRAWRLAPGREGRFRTRSPRSHQACRHYHPGKSNCR